MRRRIIIALAIPALTGMARLIAKGLRARGHAPAAGRLEQATDTNRRVTRQGRRPRR